MKMRELNDLAAAYWDHYRLFTSKDRAERLRSDELDWASDEIDELVAEQPDDAISTLVFLADAAPDDGALGYLGAGPVEELIIGHGSDVVIDRVEGAARRNERFRMALASAWYDDHVTPEVRERLRVFGGGAEHADVDLPIKRERRKGAGSLSRDVQAKRTRGDRGSSG